MEFVVSLSRKKTYTEECFIRVTVTEPSLTRLGCRKIGNKPCRTTSFSPGSNRVTIGSLRQHSCPLPPPRAGSRHL